MISELYSTLENLDEKLKELLNVVQEKKQALLMRNSKALDICIKKEESLLLNINTIERQRTEIIKKISGIEFLPADFNVDEFYSEIEASVPEKVYESINLLRKNIKEKAKAIREVNKNNMALIETSREFIRMLFQNLQGDKRSLVVNKKV